MINEEHRLSFIVQILEAPAEETARLVWADYVEEHGNANETPQLLREPGHWEMRNGVLYWVLDPPWSDWTHRYFLRQAAEGSTRYGTEVEGVDNAITDPPFKYVGHPPFGAEARYLNCWICKKGFATGRWNPKVGWSCNTCWTTMSKTAQTMNWTMTQLWGNMIQTAKVVQDATVALTASVKQTPGLLTITTKPKRRHP